MLLTYVNNKGGEAMPRPCRKEKYADYLDMHILVQTRQLQNNSPINRPNMKQLD